MPLIDEQRLGRLALQNPSPAPPTGFGQNFMAELDRTLFTNLTVSRSYSLAEAYEEYLDRAEQELGERFTNPIAQSQVGTRVGSSLIRKQFEQELFQELEERGFSGLLTPGQIQERANELALAAEENANRVSETATTAGAVGGFLGQTAGVLADPPIIASMFIGAPLATGILKTAATEAMIAGGVEAVLQPVIQAERDRLGLEAGFEQAISNIGFAAAGGALFGGAFKALLELGPAGRGAVTRLRNRLVGEGAPQINRDADALLSRIDNVERSNPFEPNGRGMAEHVRLYDDALSSLQQGRRSQLRSTTAPIKRFDPTPRIGIRVGRQFVVFKTRDLPAPNLKAAGDQVAQVGARLMREVQDLPPEAIPDAQRSAPQGQVKEVDADPEVRQAARDASDDALEAEVRTSLDQDEAFGRSSVAIVDDEGAVVQKTVRQAVDELDEDAAAVSEFEGCVG